MATSIQMTKKAISLRGNATPLSVSDSLSGSLLHGSEAKSFLFTLLLVHSCSQYLYLLSSAWRILYYAVWVWAVTFRLSEASTEGT